MDRVQLTEMVEARLSTYKIASALNTSQTNVRYWLKKYGLSTSPSFKRTYRCPCGESNPDKFYGNKARICGVCHSEYVQRKGREKRKRALEFLGNKCSRCGFDEFTSALDIHHVDTSKKDPQFPTMRGWGWERIERELANCVLLCKNCHSFVHNEGRQQLLTVAQPGGASGLGPEGRTFESYQSD